MTKLRVHCFAISLDGYGAGPDQSVDNPLGVGGVALHVQADVRRRRRTTGVDDEFVVHGFTNIGAFEPPSRTSIFATRIPLVAA